MVDRVQVDVYPDYGAFPVWIGPENYPIELEISEALQADLVAWGDEWSAAAWGRHGPDVDPDPERDAWFAGRQHDAWLTAGRALADRLQEELGDAFEVRFMPQVPLIEESENLFVRLWRRLITRRRD